MCNTTTYFEFWSSQNDIDRMEERKERGERGISHCKQMHCLAVGRVSKRLQNLTIVPAKAPGTGHMNKEAVINCL